jgi:hypothetical protein
MHKKEKTKRYIEDGETIVANPYNLTARIVGCELHPNNIKGRRVS